MMKHRFSRLLLFTVLLAATSAGASLKEVSADSAPVVLGTFTPPPIVFEETESYVKLNNSVFTVEFYKDSAGYKVYNESGAVVVYDERHVLQYWSSQGQGSWKSRGTPFNLTWVKISDYWYNVTRHYTDYLGTDWNVTFVIKSWEPIKSAVSVDSGQTDTYRISWQLSGVVYTDGVSKNNRVQFGDGRLGFDWDDVYESFGNITTATVESHAQGRKLTVSFDVGEIVAGASLVLDPTVDGATTSIPLSYAYQRGIVWDGTYWWLFYHNGTGWKYKYSSDLTTISGGATVEDVGTGGRAGGISVTFDGSTGIQTYYGYYSGNYKLRERGGTISGTTISWNAATFLLQDGSYYTGQGSVYDKAGGKSWVAIHRYTSSDVTRYRYTTFWQSDVIDGSETISSSQGGIAMVDTASGIFNVLQNSVAALRYSTDSNDFAAVGQTTAGGHAAFSVVSEGDVVHLAYLDSSNNLEYLRWNGSAWGSVETIMASASNAYCFPVISLDDANGELYVFWGDDTTDDIYYRKRDSTGVSGNWDTSSTILVNETDLTGGNKYGNGRVTAPLYFNNSQLPVLYTTGSASPYTVKVASITLNSDPIITSASITDRDDADNVYAMNKYYSFQAVVNDADGATDISKVYLRAKDGAATVWEVRADSLDGTPSWSIQSGAAIIDLDTGSSTWSENGNQGTATFKVRAEGDHTQYDDLEIAVYVEDSQGAGAGWADKQSDYFDVITRIVTENLVVSDGRINPGGATTLSGDCYYASTTGGNTAGTVLVPDSVLNGVIAHDPSHASKGSDVFNPSGHFDIALTTESTVMQQTYHVLLDLVPGFGDGDAVDGDTVTVITDRIQASASSVSDARTNVDESEYYEVTLIYDYDNTAVTDGTVTIEGASATHQGSGVWRLTQSKSTPIMVTYNSIAPEGNTHGITALDLNGMDKTITWDRLDLVSVAVDDSHIDVGSGFELRYTIQYDYDNAAFTGSDGSIVGFTWDATNGWWEKAMTGSASVMTTNYDESDLGAVTDSNYGITAVKNVAGVNVVTDQIQLFIVQFADRRIDVGGAGEVQYVLKYHYDGTAFDGGDGSIAGFTWDAANNWWDKAITGSASVTSTNYDETDLGALTDNNYGLTVYEDDAGANIITDRVEIYYEAVDDSLVLKNEYIEYRVKARLDYDNHELGTGDSVTANSGAMTWDSGNGWFDDQRTQATVGSYLFDVTAASETTYGITALYEPQSSPTGYWKDTPNNDAADSDAAFDVDVYGWVNVTVSDEDGVANLATVEVQVTTSGSEVFTLRWTQSSEVFSEESDASGVCTLDATGSTRVNVDADTDRIAFRFKVSAGAQMGAVSVQVTSTDDDGYSDQDTYGGEFSINWYGEITISDGSHSWSSLSPGDINETLVSPFDGDIDVTVSSNGVFDLQGKGGGALISGGDSIALSNVRIHGSILGSAASLTTGYVDIGGLTSQPRGLNLAKGFKLWLTVPNPQQDGSYTYTLSVQIAQP